MFAGGLANVQKQTKAQKGDKTMMDALIPAIEAIQACSSDDIKGNPRSRSEGRPCRCCFDGGNESQLRPCP